MSEPKCKYRPQGPATKKKKVTLKSKVSKGPLAKLTDSSLGHLNKQP